MLNYTNYVTGDNRTEKGKSEPISPKRNTEVRIAIHHLLYFLRYNVVPTGVVKDFDGFPQPKNSTDTIDLQNIVYASSQKQRVKKR